VLKTAAETMLRILAIVMLCKLMEQVCKDHGLTSIRLIGALAITVGAASDVKTLLGLGEQVMEQINNFSAVLLPVLASATAASGAVSGAGAFYALTVFFSDALIRVCKTCLFPLAYCQIALAASDSALGESRLKKLRDLLGWFISIGLKALLGGFTAFISVTGILSGASDSLVMKTAKLSLSAFVPVVGGILSDASDTLFAGAEVLKSAVGTCGMLALLGIYVLPFLTIAASFISYKVMSALASVLGSEQSSLLEAISGTAGYVLAMVSSCVFISLLSCCCFMKAVHIL
jgi:stage III sporulation protein AE